MKKIVVFICFLISSISFVNAQCPTGDITLTTQAEIDAFATNYPNCTEMNYDITITGAGITNFSGLGSLIEIRDLRIKNCPDLTSIIGLNNLEDVSSLELIDNPNLSSLAGFSGVESSTSLIEIINNDKLINLDGLHNILGIGSLYLEDNDELVSLTNFNVGSSGLLGVSINIENNDKLIDIDGLSSLYGPGDIWILGNERLQSLESLGGLQYNGSPYSVVIGANPNLTVCNIPIVCSYIEDDRVDFPQIGGNSGCCLSFIPLYKYCEEELPTPSTNFSIESTCTDGFLQLDSEIDSYDEYFWTFSGTSNPSPATSSNPNPVINVSNSGTLIATLKVIECLNSAEQTTTFDITVANTPIAGFHSGAIDFSCPLDGNSVQFFDSSTDAVSYHWKFLGTSNPSPSVSTVKDPIVYFGNSGSLKVILTVTNCLGEESNPFAEVYNIYLDQADIPSQDLNLEVFEGDKLSLDWVEACGEDRYRLLRATCADPFSTIAVLPSGSSNYVDTDVVVGIDYFYKLKIEKPTGNEVYTVGGNLSDGEIPKLLNTPQNFKAVGASCSSIELQWVDNNEHECQFYVYRSVDGGDFEEIDILPKNATSYIDEGLQAGIAYCYRVKPAHKVSISGSSTVAECKTLSGSAPEAPNNPALFAVSGLPDRIVVTWQDSEEAERYRILRAVCGESFTNMGLVDRNVESFTDTSVSSGVEYVYKIKAENCEGSTAIAVAGSLDEGELPVTPDAPTNLTAQANGSNVVDLSWSYTNGYECGFKILRSVNGGSFTPYDEVGRYDRTYQDDAAFDLANNQYCYKVKAFTPGGSSTSMEVCSGANMRLAIEKTSPSIKVYPNPTSGHLTLEGMNEAGADILIMDINGRVLMQQKAVGQSLNISRFPVGVYLLSIKTETDTIVKRIVKQ